MKMKMNKKKLIELFSVLTEATNMGNTKFKYGVIKNLKIIDSEIETLKTIEKDIMEVTKEFVDKRNEIIKAYGKDDGSGNISVDKTSENYDKAMEELTSLSDEYKETIDLHTEKTNDYAALLEEDTEFDFNVFEISIDNVPDTFENIKLLMDFNIIK